MNGNDENLLGGLAGAALTGLVWWDRLDQDTQRRLRFAREDAANANDKIDGWLSSPDLMRLLAATVRDVVTGVAYATQPTAQPATIPDLNASVSRPNLSQESAVTSYQWPPKTGVYTPAGQVQAIGELTPFGLALTYPEVRAAVLGFAQATQPNAAGLAQLYRATNALSQVVTGQSLTVEQHKEVWKRLYGGVLNPNPHENPALEPSVVAAVNTTTITKLTANYANRNTDAVMRFRLKDSAGIGSNTLVGKVTFATEYRYRDDQGNLVPFQPAVHITANGAVGGGHTIYANNITSKDFELWAALGVAASQPVDLFISTHAGLMTC
jgi:hypothetical protein